MCAQHFRGAAELQYEGQAASAGPPGKNHCIGFVFLSNISVPGLPGGGSGPVEVQVLLPVRLLQEMQGSAAGSVNLPG